MFQKHVALTIVAAGSVCTVANAAFDSAMYNVSQSLASFSTQIAELDLATTGYNFPFGGSFTNSGYVDEGPGGIELDRTELVARVYRVTTATTFMMGGDSITLDVGDNVYAYTVRLVQESLNTVHTMSEFQVGGFNFLGTDMMDASLVNGRGFLTPASGVGTPMGGLASDLEDLPGLGASHDWRWPNTAMDQLDNSEEITLLMFTDPSLVGMGVANFLAPPGQPAGVDPSASLAPTLIPIIPGPGPAALGMLALGVVGARRRR